MKYLSSVVDGFNILLGTHTINFACLVTLVTVIRKPPTYTKGYPSESAPI